MRRLLVILLSVFIMTACSDNLLEGMADKNSDNAKLDELEFRLNDKDYDYVISELENTSGNYGNLSLREKYLLQSAWLGKSGFSLLDDIGELFEDNVSWTTILMTTQSDGNDLTSASITGKRRYYAKIIDMCSEPVKDNDTDFIGGLASTMDTMMLMSQISIELTGSNDVSFDPNSPNYIGTIFANASDQDIEDLITPDIISSLNSDMSQLDAAVATIPDGNNQDVKNKMDDFKKEITDASGNVTQASVLNFIRTEL